MAIPAMDDLELRLQGEAKGWLDATCTYYGLVGSLLIRD